MSGTVEVRNELPPSEASIYFYPGATRGSANADGRILLIGSDDGRSWYAVCRKGAGGADGIYRFGSDSPHFVIVSEGNHYRLSTDDPVDWESETLRDGVRFAAHHDASDTILLFSWFEGFAFGPGGKIWTRGCPYASGWSVISCDDSSLRLVATDDPDQPSFDVVLNVGDGSIVTSRRCSDARR